MSEQRDDLVAITLRMPRKLVEAMRNQARLERRYQQMVWIIAGEEYIAKHSAGKSRRTPQIHHEPAIGV